MSARPAKMPLARAAVVVGACRKHIVGLLAALTLAVALFYASSDASALTSMAYVYAAIVILPLVAAFMYSLHIAPFGGAAASSAAFYGLAGAAVFIYGVMYLYTKYSTRGTRIFLNMAINAAIFGAVAVGAVISYAMFADRLRAAQDGRYGLAAQLFFYIPCLVSDAVAYLVGQYRITSTQVALLFAAEIVLLLTVAYLPGALTAARAGSQRVLLREPVFLDLQATIATSEDLEQSTADLNVPAAAAGQDMLAAQPSSVGYELPPTRAARNYSLSLWVFVNAQATVSPAYARESAILDYGYVDGRTGRQHPKPRLTYDQGAGAYYLYMTSYDPASPAAVEAARYRIRVVDLPAQRWNNFVFSYRDGVADVFINGRLERSFALGAAQPSYDATDLVTVGAAGGLFGAICNVQFCPDVLSEAQITSAYNALGRLTPPVIPV